MNVRHVVRTAMEGLRTNRMRSALTILGIVIGIAAIILIQSIGAGAQNLILSQIQGMGSKTIVVLPGRQAKGPSDFAQTLSDSLKQKDLDALERPANAPHIAQIMPIVFGSDAVSYQGNTYRPTIFGASDYIQAIFNLSLSGGTFFTNDDILSRSQVAVIGSKVREELFGASDPIGQIVKIKNRNFRVVGVMPKKGQVSFFNFDETVVVPYTTAQDYLFGIKYFNRLVVEADDEANIQQTVVDITNTLRASHGITDPTKDDFSIETQADLVKTLGTITSVLTMFLTAVAAISLVVGGVGIMNIMLVSVTERTKEIGLRKALGATNKDILSQFLAEAVLLTGTGGLIGVAIGGSLSLLVSVVLTHALQQQWPFSFSIGAVIIGIAVSGGIGLAFGLYPARQAAQKQPIEALRYE